MRGYRSYDFDGSKLAEMGRTQESVMVTVGHSRTGLLYALPYATWKKVIEETYGQDRVASAKRLNTSTNQGGMTEPELMDVLTDQVGPDGHISGGALRVLTFRGEDAAYLVPVNGYWWTRVEGEESEGE